MRLSVQEAAARRAMRWLRRIESVMRVARSWKHLARERSPLKQAEKQFVTEECFLSEW